MTRSTNKRLRFTEVEFQEIAPLLHKLSGQRVAMAKAVLVQGRTLQDVADEYVVSRNAVFKAAQKVRSIYLEFKLSQTSGEYLPPGWVRVTLAAPRKLVSQFKNEIANEYEKLFNRNVK
jgi:hypothetical protein